MAPEAASGDLRTPVDVYCFGVVLLQVVSGLKTHDEGREEKNIVSAATVCPTVPVKSNTPLFAGICWCIDLYGGKKQSFMHQIKPEPLGFQHLEGFHDTCQRKGGITFDRNFWTHCTRVWLVSRKQLGWSVYFLMKGGELCNWRCGGESRNLILSCHLGLQLGTGWPQ